MADQSDCNRNHSLCSSACSRGKPITASVGSPDPHVVLLFTFIVFAWSGVRQDHDSRALVLSQISSLLRLRRSLRCAPAHNFNNLEPGKLMACHISKRPGPAKSLVAVFLFLRLSICLSTRLFTDKRAATQELQPTCPRLRLRDLSVGKAGLGQVQAREARP